MIRFGATARRSPAFSAEFAARTFVATPQGMNPPRTNASTCLPFAGGASTPPPLGLVYSVARAAERAREEPARGYRLYWMASGRFGSCDVPFDGFVVVGRHALCDAVLDANPTIALRHLLVRATRLDDGCPRLSVLDLHTHLTFTLADGQKASSIAATGVLAFQVGAFGIVALPGGDPAPEALPEPRVVTMGPLHPYRNVMPPSNAAPASVTLLPRASFLGESYDPARAVTTISLTNGAATASVRVSPLDLELGVLVGRAPKCNGMLRTVLNEGISRVHVLLRRGKVYDLASTQGTYALGRRVRTVRFDDAVPIQLGTAHPVTLRVSG